MSEVAGPVDDFLKYAKVRRLHLSGFPDLNHQIEDARILAPEAKDAGVEIVRYLDPELPHVSWIARHFWQGVFEFDDNARQAMPDGCYQIRTVAQGDTVAVYLIDTGCGMDDRTASKMFEAFFSTKSWWLRPGLPPLISGLRSC